MRPDRIRLGILAVVTLFVFPCTTLAQTTSSTDAAIAELRQLLADQRAALDRQARDHRGAGANIGGVTAAGRRYEPEYGGTTRSLKHRRRRQRQPRSALRLRPTAADKPYGCRAHAGSARDGRVGRRFPGFDPHSRHRVVHQTRRSGANGRRSHAERPRDGGSVRHLLDPRRGPASGRGSAHGLLDHRESLEHRAADAESERADAPVHRNRLRRRRPDDRGFGTRSSRPTASSSARHGPRFRIRRPTPSGLTSKA